VIAISESPITISCDQDMDIVLGVAF
jgi:hypothetical protein